MNWLDIIKNIIEMHSLYIKSYSDHLSPNMSFPFLLLFPVLYQLNFTPLLKLIIGEMDDMQRKQAFLR